MILYIAVFSADGKEDRYVHIEADDFNNAVLKAHGLYLFMNDGRELMLVDTAESVLSLTE